MTRGLRRWVGRFVAFMAAALNAADFQQTVAMTPGADAEIRFTVPGGRMPQTGFLPMRVRVVNRNPAERTWRVNLSVQLQPYGMRGGQQVGTHEFTVPGGETREFFTFTPVPGNVEFRGISAVQAEVIGPEVQNNGRFMLGLHFGWNPIVAPLAVEPALEPAMVSLFNQMGSPGSTAMPRSGRRPGRPVPSTTPTAMTGQAMERVSVIDPSAWPADARLWSPFAVVLLEEENWERLDTARRQALMDWVALGGRLVLSPAEEGEGDTRIHGAGTVRVLPRPLADMAFDELKTKYALEDSRFRSGPERAASGVFWDLEPAKWQVGNKAGWLTGFVIVFGVLIAPVNLFYFAPAGKRHRLFFTVPLLSVVASAALFGMITISDGFGGTGMRRAAVVLIPERNQAAVFQRQISRTGLLGSRSFALPADAWMSREPDPQQLSGRALELRREGDVASGDWFSSRNSQTHELRRLMPTRERIELVSGPDEPPVIQSTIGTTLRNFGYMDACRRFWHAEEVPPGARVTLQRRGGGSGITGPMVELAGPWDPERFYALGGATAEVPMPTLPGIRWDPEGDRVLYTGYLRQPEVKP